MRILLTSLFIMLLAGCAQHPEASTVTPFANLSPGWTQFNPGGGACWFRKNCDTALVHFLAAAHDKLAKEKTGAAEDSITTLTKALKN